MGINTDGFKYSGPMAIAISEGEETAPARILKGMMKENPQIIFDGGIFNNEFIGVDVVNKLASIPSKQQLLGQLVYVLSGNVRSLAYALNAIKDKKQESSAPAPAIVAEAAPEPAAEAVVAE
jgi:large subunit ribosomal protein L10